MLSGILNSDRAINVNIEIMRAFIRLSKMLSSNASLARKVKALEKEYLKSQAKVIEPEYIGQLVTVSETLKAKFCMILLSA